MPKRVYEINPFHGGINSKDDQRDILETQLVEALNVKADSKGTLKLIGNLVSGGNDWATSADSSSGVHPGYGFFRFSSDANASGASGTDDNNTDYLIAYSEQVGKIYWWDGSAWAVAVDLSSPWSTSGSSGGGKPTFSYANGAMRVSDANFNNTTNPNYWLGYVKRHNFKGCTGADNIAAWHANKAELTTPTSGPNIKTSLMSASGDATADDITWVVATARLNTTEIHNYSLQDNSDKWWTSASSGDNIFTAQNTLFENPYDATSRQIDLAYAPDLSGDTVFSGSGYLAIGTTMQNSSANTQYFSSSFNIPTDGSLYMTVKLKDQKTFDAWNGGYAHSSETTVIFRNLKIYAMNVSNAADTDDYMSWTIPASKISLNDTDWFVLELPYDEADQNDLGSNAINMLKWSWDVTVEKSGSDSIDTTIYALSVCDARVGDKGQQGTDLLGNRKFAYSYTYDDKRSESLLREIGTVNLGTKTDGYATLFQAGVKTYANKRITGAVLYAFEEDIPYMIAELDFVKGLRGSWDTEWPGTSDTTTQFSTVDSSTTSGSTVIYNKTIPMVESYQARNGFSHKQDSIDARYKSIVITNNKAYVGNVYIDGVHYPDRMIKSQTFDYDAFPEEGRSIEVVKQDGDSIVTLAAYADRLFQYKNNKVHIINITSDQEFLEDSHTGLGVKYPYWVVEMSTGIAWFNENGAYYFDGKQINNITNGLIEDETWKTHVSSAGVKAQIFYIPKQDKIMVVGGTNGVDVYEYTIHTGGWTRAAGVFENTKYANYILDIDNTVKTFKPADGMWYTWSDTATVAKSDYEVITGDLVFDSSAVRKKIYSVHVTHKGLGAAKSMKCYGRADRAGTWTELGQLNNYTDFTVQEFDVSGVNNARSYQVRLKHYDSDSGGSVSTIPIGFEVNDINVVYRSKNVR